MQIESIEWDDANRSHALIRATEDEITEAVANATRVRRNKKRRSATHLLHGKTAGGRSLVVAVIYESAARSARPITAWEDDS